MWQMANNIEGITMKDNSTVEGRLGELRMAWLVGENHNRTTAAMVLSDLVLSYFGDDNLINGIKDANDLIVGTRITRESLAAGQKHFENMLVESSGIFGETAGWWILRTVWDGLWKK